MERREGMIQKAVILDEKSMNRAVARISCEIIERNKGAEDLCFIGIMSRGVFIAQRIAERLHETEGLDIPIGTIDKSSVSFDVRDKKVVLVDDVIFTGRSCRAAIDAVMSRGRPKCIQLAVLVDRGHRELPIRPDYVGKNVPTSRDETVRVMVKEADGCDKVIILEQESTMKGIGE